MSDESPTGTADYFDASNPDGRIRIRIEGTEYRLKRPKNKEFRRIRERLNEMAAAAAARVKVEYPEVEYDEPPIDEQEATERALALVARKIATTEAGEDALLDWWRTEVFAVLEERGQPLPDDPPVWMLNPGLSGELIEAWFNRPAHPGV